jgi:hypothetical protein
MYMWNPLEYYWMLTSFSGDAMAADKALVVSEVFLNA